MLTQNLVVSTRRRRSGSISLVLIASSVMVAGCDQRVSAGDVAYRDCFLTANDCRRDYGSDCTMLNGSSSGGYRYYGPYRFSSGGRPMPSSNSIGIQETVLSSETADRINSGAEVARGGSTSRGGFGGEGGEGGGGHGGGGGE